MGGNFDVPSFRLRIQLNTTMNTESVSRITPKKQNKKPKNDAILSGLWNKFGRSQKKEESAHNQDEDSNRFKYLHHVKEICLV